jgi:DNA-binding NtrC family response regulator
VTTTPKVRLLIAEDEEHLGVILEHFLRGRGYAVTMCRDGKSALTALQSDTYDVALMDIVMPEMDGLEVLRHLQAEPDSPEVIIITGNGTIDTAITAIKLGAYDYISKPYRMAEIDVMVRRAWEKRELTRSNLLLQTRVNGHMPSRVDSVSECMSAVVAQATAIASSSDPVVLHGASGAGKTHLARYIHVASGRPLDAYAELSSRDDGAEGILGRLFGYEVGSRRGSAPRGAGVLQLASSGTVVIDAALLDGQERRVLADALLQQSFAHVGGTQRIPLRARVIVCDRGDKTKDGVALPGAHITLPPLRQRSEDIGSLASAFVREMGTGTSRTLSLQAIHLLLQYQWPGNVRELQTVLARAAILAPRPEITDADLRMVLVWGSGTDGRGAQLADLERLQIEAMLVRSNWHQGRAADALGISTKTLYRKMREYGFVRPRKRKLTRVQTLPSE